METTPLRIIPRGKDIRQIRKYRAAYLDSGVLEDERNKYRLQPPGTLPPLTPKVIEQVMLEPDKHYRPSPNQPTQSCDFYM